MDRILANLVKVAAVATVVFAGCVVLASIPDIKRYIRISTM